MNFKPSIILPACVLGLFASVSLPAWGQAPDSPTPPKSADAIKRLTQEAYGNGLTRNINYSRQDNLRSSDNVMGEADLQFSYSYAADKQITAEKHRRLVGVLDRSEATCPEGVKARGAGLNQSIVGNAITAKGFTASYDDGNRLQAWSRDGNPDVPPASAPANPISTRSWNLDDAGNYLRSTQVMQSLRSSSGAQQRLAWELHHHQQQHRVQKPLS